MTLAAGTIIEAARNRHPAFDRGLVPSSVAATFLNKAQRTLYFAAHERNQTYLTRRWVIAFLPGQNVAQVGAGTSGSAPLRLGAVGLARSLTNAGSGATLPDEPVVLVPERAVTSADATHLSDTTASMTVDLYQGQLLELVSGLGAGQVRQVASNTATEFTVTEPWAQVPDTTTTYRVLGDAEEVTGDVGIAMGAMPVTTDRQAWLVYLDAQGQPYLDLAAPVQVPVSVGIPLPPHVYINHGLVRFHDTSARPDQTAVFTLSSLDNQVNPPTPYSGAVVNQTLQLFPPFEQWRRVTSVEIPYLPNLLTVTGADSLLQLPDAAEEALVTDVAEQMARRAVAMNRLGADMLYGVFVRDKQEMAQLYLDAVAGVGRAVVSSVVEVW